jgi:hypothetical protein
MRLSRKSFYYLRNCFAVTQSSLWRNNKNPNFQKDAMELLAALENNDIVPKADPNTASHTMRVQKAIAIYTLAQQNPSAFDQTAVYMRIFDMIGVEDAQNLFSKTPPGPPPVDETKKLQAQAEMVSAQAKILDASVRAQQAQGEQGVKMADVQTKNILAASKHEQAKAKTQIDAADIAGKLKLEQMRLQQSQLVHHDKLKQNNKHKKADVMTGMLQKGFDMDAARRNQEMDQAHQVQQADSQRLHDLSMENERAKNAKRGSVFRADAGRATE